MEFNVWCSRSSHQPGYSHWQHGALCATAPYGAPTIYGPTRADFRYAGYVAGVRGERLRVWWPQEAVGLRWWRHLHRRDDEQAAMTRRSGLVLGFSSRTVPCYAIACQIEAQCYLPRGYRGGDHQTDSAESTELTIRAKEGCNDLARYATYILRASNLHVQHNKDDGRATGLNEKNLFIRYDWMGGHGCLPREQKSLLILHFSILISEFSRGSRAEVEVVIDLVLMMCVQRIPTRTRRDILCSVAYGSSHLL